VEREHIAQAIALHEKVTGSRPLGWYQGRTSPNTARLVAEEGGFLYDADSYADDVPYWQGKQLIVPYTLDVNDMKFVALNGFTEGEQFFHYLRDTFDELCRGRPHDEHRPAWPRGRQASAGAGSGAFSRPYRGLPRCLGGSPHRYRPPLDGAAPRMNIDNPALLAEVTAAFHEYERALMEDDIPAMDRLFHEAPTTNRYGVGEVLWHRGDPRFRKGRGGSPHVNWAAWRSPSMATVSPPPMPNSSARIQIVADARRKAG
jgi:hypothetical protein